MAQIINRKARFDYEVIEKYEVGIVLTGTEIKSIREGRANLQDSYALIRHNELFLLNMHIHKYDQGNIFNHEERRSRKLLMHKKEILKLRDKIEQQGYTLVPLSLYFKGRCAKIELALGKGKKRYDKRETIKRRELDQEARKALKKYS